MKKNDKPIFEETHFLKKAENAFFEEGMDNPPGKC